MPGASRTTPQGGPSRTSRGADRSGPGPSGVPVGSGLDLALLAVAVCGISMSAPLIAATAAPALAIAFWRNAMAVGALAPFVLLRGRAEVLRMGRRAVSLSVVAGLVLAAHFALWLPSLSMTSVASSTALVTTTPIWTTLILRVRGQRQPAMVWAGSALAFAGVLLVSGVDLSLSTRALAGDALALGGGAAAAVYVLLGAEVRRDVSTSAYTAVCYSTAAVVLLSLCLLTGASVGAGYTARTWVELVALTVVAQLLGHSLINRVVRGLGPSVTSTAILLEAPGAALIAALWLGQRPPLGVYPALLAIVAGLALIILSGRRAAARDVPVVPDAPATGPGPNG